MIEFLHKRALVFGAAASTLAILLSACSGYGSQGGDASGQTAESRPSASPSAGSIGSPTRIGTRSIPGVGAVLINGEGLTLYHLTTDTSTKTTCTGSCANAGPPLLTTNGDAPNSSGVRGQFGTLTRPNAGVQITFDGLPLYTYAGDSQPGQANGQGIGGVWFAVSP